MTQDDLQEIFDRVEKVARDACGTGDDDCDEVLLYDAPQLAAELTKALAAISVTRLFLETSMRNATADTDLATLAREVIARNTADVVRLDLEAEHHKDEAARLRREVARLTEENKQLSAENLERRQACDGLAQETTQYMEEIRKLKVDLQELREERKAKKKGSK